MESVAGRMLRPSTPPSVAMQRRNYGHQTGRACQALFVFSGSEKRITNLDTQTTIFQIFCIFVSFCTSKFLQLLKILQNFAEIII